MPVAYHVGILLYMLVFSDFKDTSECLYSESNSMLQFRPLFSNIHYKNKLKQHFEGGWKRKNSSSSLPTYHDKLLSVRNLPQSQWVDNSAEPICYWNQTSNQFKSCWITEIIKSKVIHICLPQMNLYLNLIKRRRDQYTAMAEYLIQVIPQFLFWMSLWGIKINTVQLKNLFELWAVLLNARSNHSITPYLN